MKEHRELAIVEMVNTNRLRRRRGLRTGFALLLTAFIFLCIFAIAQEDNTSYVDKKTDYWYQRGLQSAGEGSYKEALLAYDKAIQIDPENVGAWDGKALALKYLSFAENDTDKYNESLEAYDKAIELYDRKIEANPQDTNALYYKGLALTGRALTMKAGEKLNINSDKEDRVRYFEEAINAYDKAIEIDPKYVTAWKNKGNVLYSLGRYNESLEALDKAIEIVPEYGLAWYSKGLTLYELGRYEESIQAYDKALETFPDNAGIWYNKGNALEAQGEYDAAVDGYDYAIKLDPSLAEAWHGKGLAFEKLGLDTSADAAFNRARQLGYEG
jgi:tetratricopeptide (TPR) repeat protein